MHGYVTEGRGGGHCRHRHHPRGDWFFGPGFGPGRGPRGRGRKARRGDIRTAALLLLAEEPRNGYQIMQELEERSEGVWRPSPGSVYPALSQLEDEGLIGVDESEGRKAFAITDAGRELLAQRDTAAPAPWEQMSGDVSEGVADLARLMRETAFAFSQVMRTGSDALVARARGGLDRPRRELYTILADGAAGEAGEAGEGGEGGEGGDNVGEES